MKISKELADGQLVCIFPEGEITRDGKLSKFRAGIERALAENPVPVIPMTLTGLWGSFFSRKFGGAGTKYSLLFKNIRGLVEIKIGKLIPVEKAKAPYLQEVTQNMLDNKKE